MKKKNFSSLLDPHLWIQPFLAGSRSGSAELWIHMGIQLSDNFNGFLAKFERFAFRSLKICQVVQKLVGSSFGSSLVNSRVSQTPFLSGFKLLRSFSHPTDLKKAPCKISVFKVKFYRFPQAPIFYIVYPNSKIWPNHKIAITHQISLKFKK